MIEIEIHKKLHGSKGSMDLDLHVDIAKGSFVSLMGESGSGKTTLLRVLAGLEKAEGNISVDGLAWLKKQKMLPPQQREIGFVFQDYALFENMSVEENLLYVNEDKILAHKLLEMTELGRLASRNVKGLSGGQKQRVSLCRAMMNRPKLLLMDEPLSAVDPAMRIKLQDEIRKLHQTFGTTTIMVSHDTDVSYYLSDRILVLDHGKIIADGTPEEILVKSTKEVYTLV